MVDVELTTSQQKILGDLDKALEILEAAFDRIEKYDYPRRYARLNRSEDKWAVHQDYEGEPPMDLAIRPVRFDQADIEVLQELNKMAVNVGDRISRLSKEKTRAQQNLAEWHRIYKSCLDLKDQYEALWMTIPEIKSMRSKEIREAEIIIKMRDFYKLFNSIRAYFWEGKHNDHGEALSYFEAVRDAIKTLDKEAEKVSRQLSTFREMRPAHEG